MRRIVSSTLLGAVALGAVAAQAAPLANSTSATSYATVLSSTPVLASVAVPQRVCSDEQRVVQPAPTGAGALLGAIAGGVIGNSIGSGGGRAAATGLGLVAGSVIGDRVEANGTPAVEVPVRRCQTVSSYQQRTVGYDVVYEYAGQRYTTRLANDPGDRLPVSVQPVGAALSQVGAPVALVAPPVSQPVPLIAQPAPVYVAPADYYPVPLAGQTVYLNPTVVYGYGYRGHRYWR